MKSRLTVKPNQVHQELLDEQSPELLKELHLLTRDGALNADARRKLKQVNHLVNLMARALDDIFFRFENPVAIDVGAGKAYLGFILYQLYFSSRQKGQIISIETRKELVQSAQEMASRLKFEKMQFVHSTIGDFSPTLGPSQRINLVTALHACDTVTDDALILGVKSKADYLVVVPCCQAEVAELLKKEKASEVSSLWNHGIHRREFGSHLTNVIRVLALESLGYQVTVTELVGWEHSLKNELILAKRVQNENTMAKEKLQKLLADFEMRPKIIRDLFADL
jgi:protein-L-isoaspartate O-methyltransferase